MTLLLTYPGVPGLYYGDEIGMLDQPGLRSRACMEWDSERWNHDLRNFFKDLIHLRRSSPALQRGGFQIVTVEEHLIAYQRALGSERWLVIAQRNASPRPAGPLDLRVAGLPDGDAPVRAFQRAESTGSGRLAGLSGTAAGCDPLASGVKKFNHRDTAPEGLREGSEYTFSNRSSLCSQCLCGSKRR